MKSFCNTRNEAINVGMTVRMMFPILSIIAVFHSLQYGVATSDDVNLQHAVTYADDILKMSKMLENAIVNHDTVLKQHTPDFKEYLNTLPSEQAFQQGLQALVAVKASVYISNQRTGACSRNLGDECARYLASLSLKETSLGPACEAEQTVSCDSQSKYRTFNGECNNVPNPVLGKANTAYGRALSSHYFRAIERIIPGPELFINSLPHPRTISVELSTPSGEEENSATLAVMQWAEFIANDLSFTATRKMIHTKEPIICCSADGKTLAPRHEHNFCAPIKVERNDPFYGRKYITCLNYVRSLPAFNSDCTFGPMEQMNQATHFLDASMIYGTTMEKANSLRAYRHGLLRYETKNGYDYMPNSNSEYKTECQGGCYDTGDDRVNDHPQLAALHTIWLREHNRVAAQLYKVHSDWSDEVLFEEARRIVIAEIQHITYNEFLPILLGEEAANAMKAGNYDPHKSPVINNEVATAALRFLTSLVQQELSLPNESRQIEGTLRLSDLYFKPRIIETNGKLDFILRGLATQSSQKMDIGLVPDLTGKLYANDSKGIGLDILSLDIQRGRDHGFPGYNAYREHCGLPAANTFNELTEIPVEVVEKLKKLYKNVNDIDLLVGAFAERQNKGIVGKTIGCLLFEQFERTRIGDRYFYDNPRQPHPFTPEQLAKLQNVTLAHIICKNSDYIINMQPNVFLKPGPGNEVVSCNSINHPDVPV